MQVTVKVYRDEEEIVSKTLSEGSYSLGRSDSCDIVLNDEKVSRNHVELRITDSAVYFTNMSSGGKIFHNGETVETGEIASGDQLILGDYRLLMFRGTSVEPQPSGGSEFVMSNDDSKIAQASEPESLDSKEPQGDDAFNVSENFGGNFDSQEGVDNDAFNISDNFGGQSDDQGADAAEAGSIQPQEQAAVANDPYSEGTAALKVETQLQMKPLVAKMIFTEGPLKGEEFFLETYEITLGRSRKADIFIDDAKLSRVHAKITRMGMGYRLIDLSSRNGTYVNGMRILEHPLNSYDVVGLGKSKIKFLIHDMVANEPTKVQQGLAPVPSSDPTKSVQMTPSMQQNLLDIQNSPPSQGMRNFPAHLPPPPPPPGFGRQRPGPSRGRSEERKSGLLTKLALVAVIAGGVIYLTTPETPSQTDGSGTDVAETTPDPGVTVPNIPAPPSMPQEYMDLSDEAQRAVEGHYSAARRAADRTDYDESLFHLNKIHDALPYYKNSRELRELVEKKINERRFEESKQKAVQDEKQDLVVYLEDGIQYLRVGEFARAAESFNSAIVIDPNNDIAKTGLRAAQLKIRDIQKVPKEVDPEIEKRKKVIALFQEAVKSFANKSYQRAIEVAEQIRTYELEGDTQYLAEAKQIIDRARMLQKEEFEPFLIQAKEKFVEGDYNAARTLCEEMLKRDPSYEPAKKLLKRCRKKLNSLAKESYVTGYILESMGKIDEAMQYWMRAKNYVRPGDEYYDKIMKKIEKYQ